LTVLYCYTQLSYITGYVPILYNFKHIW